MISGFAQFKSDAPFCNDEEIGRLLNLMKISRRNLLLKLGLQYPAMIALPSFALAESPFKSFQLVLSDITATTPADGLLAILEPFVKARIPISCVVSPQSDTGTLRPDSTLAEYLRRLIADYPAQVEVVLKTPTLTDRPYYFQSRLATQARQQLKDGLLTAQPGQQLARSVLTLANFGTPQGYEPAGVRAAGFRTVLSLPRSGIEPVDSRWDRGVLHIFGGMHFRLDEPFELVKGALTASVRDDPRSLLTLSTQTLTPENIQSAVVRMTAIATFISGLAEAGQIVPTTPTEYHVRASPNTDTVIGLRLDVLGGPDDPISGSALELAKWLHAHSFAFTLAGETVHAWEDAGVDVCRPEGRGHVDGQSPDCVIGNGPADTQDMLSPPPRIKMAAFREINLVAGVDQQATFHPPRYAFVDEHTSARQTFSRMNILEDTVLVLDQKSYSTVAQRQKTIDVIKKLNKRSSFRVSDVAALVDQIQPLDSIRRVFHQTREVMHREHGALTASEPLDRNLLRDDAALAWRYFTKFSNAETGLIPSTALLSDEGSTFYNYATMWDIGSQIFGMIAAVELDLMTLPELNDWAARLIDSLPSVSVQGLRLPGAIIHVDGIAMPDQSFNTCDVGRLLNAFHRLRLFSPALKDIIEQKVADWSLQDTIRDGRMHDLTNNRSKDRFISHCTNYAARGYATFGLTANSPYAPLNGRSDADASMALLFSASTIGGIGAEPLLLEGVELGFSPETQYLADMLFAAQLEDNRKTGTLRCVSEGPLNEAPWFSYQGYNLNNFADPWLVQVISSDKQYKSPDFIRSIEMVSVKAAYLWAATHPHSYSHALVDYVRSRARIESVGFSSGIFLETGLPIKNYSDLNTNGIILQAAAHILNA